MDECTRLRATWICYMVLVWCSCAEVLRRFQIAILAQTPKCWFLFISIYSKRKPKNKKEKSLIVLGMLFRLILLWHVAEGGCEWMNPKYEFSHIWLEVTQADSTQQTEWGMHAQHSVHAINWYYYHNHWLIRCRAGPGNASVTFCKNVRFGPKSDPLDLNTQSSAIQADCMQPMSMTCVHLHDNSMNSSHLLRVYEVRQGCLRGH